MKKGYVFFGILLGVIGVVVAFFLRPREVNLVYMADAKYLPYVMVSLDSAVAHKKSTTKYNVYIIAKDFMPNDVKNAQKLAREDISINVVPAKELNLDYSHLGRFSSFEISLQKIFIPEYLPQVDKALYLDADTLVQQDLTAVYEEDVSAIYGRAVKDGLMFEAPEHMAELNLEWRNFYFNSGVMLLNLSKMRKDNIVRQAVVYFNTHTEVYGDQDILNVIFKDKVKPLSYKYNCNSKFFEEQKPAFLSKFYEENIPINPLEVYKKAAILHFAGHKPWTPWFTHAYLRPLWHQYANEVKRKYHIAF